MERVRTQTTCPPSADLTKASFKAENTCSSSPRATLLMGPMHRQAVILQDGHGLLDGQAEPLLPQRIDAELHADGHPLLLSVPYV